MSSTYKAKHRRSRIAGVLAMAWSGFGATRLFPAPRFGLRRGPVGGTAPEQSPAGPAPLLETRQPGADAG